MSCGVLASGSASSARMRARRSLCWNPCLIASDTFLAISVGVPVTALRVGRPQLGRANRA